MTPLLTSCLVGSESSNPYIITGCGDKQQLLESHIQTLKVALSQAIADSSNGIRSRHGFQAFFKSNESVPLIRNLFLDIQSGRSIPFEADSQLNSRSHPQIFCATELLDQTGPLANLQPWRTCSTNTEAVGFHYATTPYIVLCPPFWIYPAEPQPGRHNCGTVGLNNQFNGGRSTDDGGETIPGVSQELLVGYQIYHLFHEIVHCYLGPNSLGEETVPKELYDWNECIALRASESVHNPMNYQLYLASRVVLFVQFRSFLGLTSVPDVVAGCTQFPKPPFHSLQTLLRLNDLNSA